MSTFAFFSFCIQACLVLNVFSSCFGAIIAPKPQKYAYKASCAVPAKSCGFTEYAGPYTPGTKYTAPYAYATEYTTPYTYATEYTTPCVYATEYSTPYACATEYAAPCAYGKGFAGPFAGPYVQ